MLARRTFLQSAAVPALRVESGDAARFPDLLRAPDVVAARVSGRLIRLERRGEGWMAEDIHVTAEPGKAITLSAPKSEVGHVLVRWRGRFPKDALYLGDHWERSYGDLEWRASVPNRAMPWYFVAAGGGAARGYGVKTGASAICFWQVDPEGVSLWLDVRNGGEGVRLGERVLAVAVVCQTSVEPGRSPFATARELCGALSTKPRLPGKPVYGGNNWYYTYGKNFTAEDVVRDSRLIAELAPAGANRPFFLIDEGWTRADEGAGPTWETRAGFPDMPALAERMRAAGARPAIWMRPLLTVDKLPEAWRQPGSRVLDPYFTLDPSVPEALEYVRRSVRVIRGWGFELIKHDYSTFDILGRWGFQMGAALTNPKWRFHDGTRTTAEIVTGLYRALREAAGDGMLLGCNTIGHLGAGLFEVQRIGDDVSAYEWERTRKMGVNTLAFRAVQHGTFFSADADCVPVVPGIPWELTRQWLDLIARSGTPLFASIDPKCAGAEQRRALRDAFAVAAVPQPVPEPLDWMRSTAPERWRLGGREVGYHWYPAEGALPFV